MLLYENPLLIYIQSFRDENVGHVYASKTGNGASDVP